MIVGKTIVISGIKRSGSTAQFNMVRLAIKLSGIPVTNSGDKYVKPAIGYNIVKKHPYDKQLSRVADHVFTTSRDGDEITKSLKIFAGFKKGEEIEGMKRNLRLWMKNSTHMDFYDIVRNPLSCIKKIIHVLDLPVSAEDVLIEFEKIKPPKSGKDPETLLFHNHITKY